MTDISCRGDRFEVFDFGRSLGTTSAVPAGRQCPDVQEVNDPAIAFLDPTYSHGTFVLQPGDHAITIRAVVRPFGGGGAYLRVDTLPLPMSRDQCKRGGWEDFGAMSRNQGQCVALVQRGQKP